ncbi:MAG: hypothetical protein WCR95_03545 [Eubacteriales bacterium]
MCYAVVLFYKIDVDLIGQDGSVDRDERVELAVALQSKVDMFFENKTTLVISPFQTYSTASKLTFYAPLFSR